jgi:hypothetical protein
MYAAKPLVKRQVAVTLTLNALKYIFIYSAKTRIK